MLKKIALIFEQHAEHSLGRKKRTGSLIGSTAHSTLILSIPSPFCGQQSLPSTSHVLYHFHCIPTSFFPPHSQYGLYDDHTIPSSYHHLTTLRHITHTHFFSPFPPCTIPSPCILQYHFFFFSGAVYGGGRISRVSTVPLSLSTLFEAGSA